MDRRRIGVRDEAHAAARLIFVGGAHGDAFFGLKRALRVVCGLATLHADGVGLRNVFGDG